MNLALHNVDDLFAALGDRIRLRLACCLLAVPTGACVCELVDALDESQPNVSRHLKVLKAARLVEERREGRWMYYRLCQPDHPLLDSIRACIATAPGALTAVAESGRIRSGEVWRRPLHPLLP